MPMLKKRRGGRQSRDGTGGATPPTRKRAPRPPVPPDAGQFLNRELSILAFFRRVLEEAQDERNPLLERVKFLSIVGSNLAEFFMVRVAGLNHQVEAGIIDLSSDGLTPSEQLLSIRQVVLDLMQEARKCLQQLVHLLAEAGIHIHDYQALTDQERTAANEYFEQVVFPVLTPLAFDPGRPFPYISNMSLNLAVLIRDPAGQERFARVKVPNTLPRLLPIKKPEDSPDSVGGSQPTTLVWLEQVIGANLHRLFPGMEVVQSHPFRVTRDAEMAIQEMEAEDLLETIERSVRERRFGSVVRVTVDPDMPSKIRDILTENLNTGPHGLYTVDPPLGTSDLIALHSLDRPALKDTPFLPAVPPALDEGSDFFAAIRRQDILLHHPYDSFTPVVALLRAAAHDPQVLAIKQTLYRVGRNSPVVEALLEAAANGKQVAVLVELKARFDEESNIEWAKSLEGEGVHVVYGLPGLKTHAKVALLVRKEGDGIRRYVHLSTGNYNPVTAQVYTDIGLLTCDEAFGADASDLFNYLTGYSAKREYQRFLVAPINLRAGFQALIEREIDRARQSDGGHLIFKLNHLVDKRMIQWLNRASQAGVKVDLLIRGTCCLRPGVEGLSQNIQVTSIVGRFLEHSRVYYFRNGGSEEIYVGSADLMPRNLDRRVETLFPIQDPRLVHYLREHVLATYLADTVKARRLRADGTYERVKPTPSEPPLDSQQWLIDHRAQGVVTHG
ncbi:MAG TPA: polyphosphate kinase 1 [Candidatus Methylomirabilis sp.]|nr:polyphosphate kinase 1 [Candidatus Methylomirabilis sp.]